MPRFAARERTRPHGTIRRNLIFLLPRAVRVPERGLAARLEDGTDAPGVADGRDDPGRRVEEPGRGVAGLRAGHGADALPPRRELVLGQAVEDARDLVLDDAAGGLARNRERSQDVVLGALVFVGVRAFAGERADEVEHAAESLLGHLGPAVDRRAEVAAEDARRERRVRAVRQGALLAQHV